MEGRVTKTIKVKVRFYAKLKDELGIDEISIPINERSLFALLRKLNTILKDKLPEPIDSLIENTLIAVNNELVREDDLKDLTLNNGDIVDIMPLPSGG